MAVAVAQPTDVVKVRFQAQARAEAGRRYQGTLDAYKTIAREEGVRGLWKGGSQSGSPRNLGLVRKTVAAPGILCVLMGVCSALWQMKNFMDIGSMLCFGEPGLARYREGEEGSPSASQEEGPESVQVNPKGRVLQAFQSKAAVMGSSSFCGHSASGEGVNPAPPMLRFSLKSP